MRKEEIIRRIAKDSGQEEVSIKKTIESLLRVATVALESGEEIRFHNFGVLLPWKQTGRPARNPKTGTPVMINPRTSVKFRPGRLLMQALNV